MASQTRSTSRCVNEPVLIPQTDLFAPGAREVAIVSAAIPTIPPNAMPDRNSHIGWLSAQTVRLNGGRGAIHGG
jgi:hypothetical protein